MTDTRNIVTVWRRCTPTQNRQDVAANARVEVHTDRLDDIGTDVLYEMHVPRDLLFPTTDEKVFTVEWAEAQKWPYQVIAH